MRRLSEGQKRFFQDAWITNPEAQRILLPANELMKEDEDKDKEDVQEQEEKKNVVTLEDAVIHDDPSTMAPVVKRQNSTNIFKGNQQDSAKGISAGSFGKSGRIVEACPEAQDKKSLGRLHDLQL